MTKADLAHAIHERMGFTKREAAGHVDALISLIKDNLEQGEKIKIAGFGVFDIRHKHARRGRNPQTGDAITIEQRKILTFKPSIILRDRINTGTP